MANEENKEIRSQGSYDPVTGKRKVVLGEEDYTGPVHASDSAEPSGPSGDPRADLEGSLGYNNTAREAAEAARRLEEENQEPPRETGFFRKFLNRDEAGDGFAESDRDASPVFDESRDAVLAEESTRGVPMRLLGEDEETETRASRMLREKDYAALATEETVQPGAATTDRERRNARRKNSLIFALVLAAIGALLFFLAPTLQEMIFKTPDNTLIFNPATGITGPRAGVLMIFLGIAGLVLIFSTMFTKRKEETLSKRAAGEPTKANPFRTAGLILLIFIPIGFAMLFNFTEFRNDDIRSSSLFNQNKTAAYSQVTQQEVYSEGENIFYRIKATDLPASTMDITQVPLENVKLLDTKLPASRNVVITSDVIEKMVEKEIYTNEEAVRLFINKR